MNRIYYICLFTVIFLGFTSCEDFLEYDESSTIDKDMAFSNMERASKVALNCYTYIKHDFSGAMRSSACDESVYVWPNSSIHRYYNTSWSPFTTVDDKWSHYYDGIFACNNFLENGADLEFLEYSYDENYENDFANYKSFKWEVRALRAFYHFELAKRYGAIPVVEKVLDVKEANQVKQKNAKEVMQWIGDECEACYENLPEKYDFSGNPYNGQAGRVTKLFVKALKSRALLYGASPLHNNGVYNMDMLRNSAKASLDVINTMEEAGVKLSRIRYTDLWNASGDKHVKCKEVIAKVRINSTNSFEKTNFPISVEGGKSGNCPTQNLVDAYDMQSGFTYDPQNPYANRDERLLHTIVVNQSEWAYGETMNIYKGGKDGAPIKGATPTGYYLKKFAMNNTNLNSANETKHKMIWILFRLGEMYLNYAEAASQINGVNGTDAELTLSAIDAINKVRDRKGLSIDMISESIDIDVFMAKCRKERMVELAFEDHRFWDVRRWMIAPSTNIIKTMKIEKKADDTFTYDVEVDNKTRKWNDKYYFYPINQKEISINKNLTNNGW
ncbi:MAG: RagB/SusD family nutrient uptake outer membrane protein [Carboxylicivirga sp.]|nr:RagB/SusD family nutrient uptake outer membrane protein [Carboxylicivirga sp.]